MNYFFTLHSFLEVGKTQDLPSKFWQTLGDALIIPSGKNKYRHVHRQNAHSIHVLIGETNEVSLWFL
jgi:hypothetical protein